MKNTALRLRIILHNPPVGVDYALQSGRGGQAMMGQPQQSQGQDLVFDFEARINTITPEGYVTLLGEYVQGPPHERFVYLLIGTSAGQHGSPWQRRLKVPLSGIATDLVTSNMASLQALVEGIGKDGTPRCGTVKPFGGWHKATEGVGN